MKKGWLFWTPRALSIVFILFISIFAFGEPVLSWGFLIHFTPSIFLIALLIFSWKWETVGGIFNIITGLVFVAFFRTYEDLFSFVFITLPWIVIGVLFILNDSKRKR